MKKNNNSQVKKQNNGIENPVNTISGKILIWILIIVMVGGSIIGLIFSLIDLF